MPISVWPFSRRKVERETEVVSERVKKETKIVQSNLDSSYAHLMDLMDETLSNLEEPKLIEHLDTDPDQEQ